MYQHLIDKKKDKTRCDACLDSQPLSTKDFNLTMAITSEEFVTKNLKS